VSKQYRIIFECYESSPEAQQVLSKTVMMADRLDAVVKQGKAQNWTTEQYRAKTREVLSEVRQELRSGNLGLNKNHRPNATKW
jgi:hypothetical protein